MLFKKAGLRVLAAVLAGGQLAGCSQEAPPTAIAVSGSADVVANDCSHGADPASAEGEVFGRIYFNGVVWCDTLSVSLSPSIATLSRLHGSSYSSSLTALPHWRNAFEWWDPASGEVPCATSGSLSAFPTNGAGSTERDHDGTGPKERHCVRPGRYTFALNGELRTFDVDYIQTTGSSATDGSGITYIIENPEYDASSGYYYDLIIHTDFTATHLGNSPVLEIQNAGSDPNAPGFSDDASLSGTFNDWFRFNAGKSTSAWAVASNGRRLARLYWDTLDLNNSTGYYSPTHLELNPVLRVQRFPNPATASRVYTVGLEILTPDEQPANAPTVTRNITIYRVNPDLSPGTTSPGSGSVTAGNSFSVSLQERNISAAATAEAGWIVQYFLSLDTVYNAGSDPSLGSFVETDSITASTTKTVSRTVTVPWSTPPGTYRIFAKLDAGGGVLESNESNNQGISASSITVNPVPVPTGFTKVDCWRDISEVPVMVTQVLGWTNPSGASGWDLVVKTTNDTTSGMTPTASGTTGNTYSFGPFAEGTKGIRYFFLRSVFGVGHSRWIPSSPATLMMGNGTGCRSVV